MTTVKLSPKFQVVIPKEIRVKMGLRAGEPIQVIRLENRIELIPLRPLRKMRGFLKGLDSTFERDRDDRV